MDNVGTATRNGVDGATLMGALYHGNLAAALGVTDTLHQTKLRVTVHKHEKEHRKHAQADGED